MISANDCSGLPSEFARQTATPTPEADSGVLYGQATPRKIQGRSAIELHYYHLWRTDCGRLGHPLDAEHVAALLRLEQGKDASDAASWQAEFWYAAAHEDTVCDASQIARASTLQAETHGADIWVSSGKHASFLTEKLCTRGCGGDLCEDMVPVPALPVVNLGEWNHPMSGAIWMTSDRWPLSDKIRRSDFLDVRIQRLLRLPVSDVAWANPEKRPAQGAILGGNYAINGAFTGVRSTDTAISVAGDKTGDALDTATGHTENALGAATHRTGHALGISVRAVGKALGLSQSDSKRETAK